ncbi:MAG TPA: metal ABC transporter permease [Anaerolineae bacterium]|nr:metal ABC transporter permease [Anaerolineae bacterium]HID84553.1 metal ABC transporter permease [Anaerolineales bacterium]HIQ08881.1 metal ABC transporter permease [Anaerolineaceae bacterium]
MALWHYAFMQRALFGGVLVGVMAALMGVYVVLRGMSFIGTGVAHAALGGVALGLWLGIHPLVAAIGFCVLVAWGIGAVSRKGALKEDTAVGIFFAASMAFGVLLFSLRRGYEQDLMAYLFGSILAIRASDLWVVVGVGVLVVLAVTLFYKEFLFITFDPEGARVAGIPEGPLYYLMLTLIALTVVAAIKVVGIVLVSALLVTPAAAAYRWTRDFAVMMALAVGMSVLSVVAGLWLSALWNLPSGAAIVLLSTALFGLSLWRKR